MNFRIRYSYIIHENQNISILHLGENRSLLDFNKILLTFIIKIFLLTANLHRIFDHILNLIY